MMGVGRRNRNRNRDRIRSQQDRTPEAIEGQRTEPRLAIVDDRSEMPMHKFELYFRVYLLIRYY